MHFAHQHGLPPCILKIFGWDKPKERQQSREESARCNFHLLINLASRFLFYFLESYATDQGKASPLKADLAGKKNTLNFLLDTK
jgi:hypothetical protein